MKILTSPETGETITCERCGYYPATREHDYTDEQGRDACDLVCSECVKEVER